ncbi:hypothetical protein HPB51_016618 [Rhipicephalus microplus]|uniref:Uncharacterized protein n=1 Tax=Rhipicephalus microplus TaxID=6941 RepID=A0A9J6EHI8_RHIMP|nr:hypothetical protein HPB51_016618 [Rhipicephalus microplus]
MQQLQSSSFALEKVVHCYVVVMCAEEGAKGVQRIQNNPRVGFLHVRLVISMCAIIKRSKNGIFALQYGRKRQPFKDEWPRFCHVPSPETPHSALSTTRRTSIAASVIDFDATSPAAAESRDDDLS